MMKYYNYQSYTFCSDLPDLPFQEVSALPAEGMVYYLFRRRPLAGRDCFAVTHPSLLTDREGAETLDSRRLPPPPPVSPELAEAIAAGRVRGVNLDHPRWEELLRPLLPGAVGRGGDLPEPGDPYGPGHLRLPGGGPAPLPPVRRTGGAEHAGPGLLHPRQGHGHPGGL